MYHYIRVYSLTSLFFIFFHVQDSVEGSVSVTKQRTGSIGDRPARPTLLEQVLNKKRLSLLRSPEVVQFLQKQQQLLSQQALEQRQQQFQGAPG